MTPDDLVTAGAWALWSSFNPDHDMPPEARWEHERAVRAVLAPVLPLVAEYLRTTGQLNWHGQFAADAVLALLPEGES